jgi:AraC-like DNA-binding protein
VDLAVPIIARGQYIGAIMAGQVRLTDEKEVHLLERIVSSKDDKSDYVLNTTLLALYETLPAMSLEKVEAIAAMLSHISRYMVDSAINNQDHIKEGKKDHKEYHEPPLSNTLLYTPMNADFLKPALQFLEQHVNKHVYAQEMATLCNVSLSYFSKSFNKVTGKSFSAYQNMLKIQAAELLLMDTNQSVNQIADELAYENASYFIKLFKRQTGVTPSQFRHNYHLKQVVDHHNSM